MTAMRSIWQTWRNPEQSIPSCRIDREPVSARKRRMRIALSLLLFLSACGSKNDSETARGGQPDSTNLEFSPPGTLSLAQLESKAAQALASVLLSPRDARYWNVRPGSGGAVCGEVDSRQEDGKFGGPRPFVVTAEGVAVVSPATRVVYGDPGDLFPDFYIRWCATPEELAKLGPNIREEAPAEPGMSNMANVTDMPLPAPASEPPLPAAPPASPPAEAPKAEQASPRKQPSGDQDSFFNAVIRKKN